MYLIYAIVLLLCLWVLYSLRNGAIYLPTSDEALQTMIRLAKVKPGERVADLGSGDGRIVLAFSRAGADAVGYENNPVLMWWSRYRGAKVIFKSFWEADLSSYDIVVVFGMTHIMDRLEMKLIQEMKPGSRIISNVFKFKSLERIGFENGVSLYRIK